MSDHTIVMQPVTGDRADFYGVTHESTYVYRTGKSSYPTRVAVWVNTSRVNPRNGEPVRFGDFGPIDGGTGRYLDPRRNATDDPTTVLLSTEPVALDAYGSGTGAARSGQVWADGVLRHGDRITLIDADGSTVGTFTAVFTSNGHGYLAPIAAGQGERTENGGE